MKKPTDIDTKVARSKPSLCGRNSMEEKCTDTHVLRNASAHQIKPGGRNLQSLPLQRHSLYQIKPAIKCLQQYMHLINRVAPNGRSAQLSHTETTQRTAVSEVRFFATQSRRATTRKPASRPPCARAAKLGCKAAARAPAPRGARPGCAVFPPRVDDPVPYRSTNGDRLGLNALFLPLYIGEPKLRAESRGATTGSMQRYEVTWYTAGLHVLARHLRAVPLSKKFQSLAPQS